MHRVDEMCDRGAGRDVFAALRQPFGHDARERCAQFRLFEIVERCAMAHLRLLQLRGQHRELRTHFIELRLRDRIVRELLDALELARRHRPLRVDARDFGLRVLDLQSHGFILQLRDALAGAHACADFGDVFESTRCAGREPRIVAADDVAGRPAPRRDARHRGRRDFDDDGGLLVCTTER